MGQLHSYFGRGSICVGWHMCDGAHEDHRDNLKLHFSDTIHVVFVFSFYGGGSLTGASQADQSGWPVSSRNLPNSYFLVTELQKPIPHFFHP